MMNGRGAADWVEISDLAPDLMNQATRSERALVTKYYAKIQRNPASFQSMTRELEPSQMRYAQLAFSLAWYAMVRRYVLPFAILGSLGIASDSFVPGSLLLIAGSALWLPALFIYALLARRGSKYNSYFRGVLGPLPPRDGPLLR